MQIYSEVEQILSQSAQVDLSTLPSKSSPVITSLIEANLSHYEPEILKRIHDEILSCGPIELLIADKSITEIVINGSSFIGYEKHGQFHIHNDQFLSSVSYNNFVHRVCEDSQVNLSLAEPFANGVWRDFRFHASQPPLVEGEVHLTLRRQMQSVCTLDAMADLGFATQHQVQILRAMVEKGESFLIAGPTGAGKTTLLNACLQQLPPTERIITIEDTSEIHLPNNISAKLLTRIERNGLQRFDQADLVRESMRMRPQRLIMGEVRGPEARDFLLALSTGHAGSICTIHAAQARQALWRLEMLVQMGAPQWSTETIRRLIYLSLSKVVVLELCNSRRYIQGIYEISGLENEVGLLLDQVC